MDDPAKGTFPYSQSMIAGRMAKKSMIIKKSRSSFFTSDRGQMTSTRTMNSSVKMILKMSSAISNVGACSVVEYTGMVLIQKNTIDTRTQILMIDVNHLAARLFVALFFSNIML